MPRARSDKDAGKSAISRLPQKTRIGILLYSGARLGAVHGLTDLFEAANHLSEQHGGQHPAELQISHWVPNPMTGQPQCVFESCPHQGSKLDCLIFPPTLEIN